MTYLSPAFTTRNENDLQFLAGIDGATGFGLFWIDVIRPLLEASSARRILEVGADQGQHTRLLIDYCQKVNGTLTVVEPFVSHALRHAIKDKPFVQLVAEKSQKALTEFPASFDAILLEGDLNYAAVTADLHALESLCKKNNSAFPLLFVKNVSWMYAFRDMYYDPQANGEATHPYESKGITPWSAELVTGKINSNFPNAKLEGGPANGVLAAVNDFIASRTDLALFRIPYNFGLGIVYTPDSTTGRYIREMLQPPPGLALLIETFELARINEIIRQLTPPEAVQSSERRGIGTRVGHLIRRFGGALLRRLEK